MECLTELSYSLSGHMLPCKENGFEFRKYWYLILKSTNTIFTRNKCHHFIGSNWPAGLTSSSLVFVDL